MRYTGSLILLCHTLVQHTAHGSPFWNRADYTADLSVLRQAETSPVFTKFVPAEITAPLFFPLCGNGRLDTKDDYARLFQTDTHRLRISRASFGSITMIDNTNLDAEYELSMMADEVCDDGNRKDFDGCSADCLSVDLWTSSCEIAMDRQLQYEHLLAVPDNRGDMIASAKDGLYLLRKIQPDERVQTSVLLAPKTFPATNVFFSSTGEDLILYSSSQQRLWRLQNGKTTLSNEFDISATLRPWNSSAHVLEDSLLLNDENTLLLLNRGNYSIINQCTFTDFQFDHSCVYIVKTSSSVQLRCDSTKTVYKMNLGDQCTTETHSSVEFSGMNIWQDVFNSLTNVLQRSFEQVSGFDASFNPPFLDKYNTEFQLRPIKVQAYAATGVMLEALVGSPRALLENTPGISVNLVGDELFAAWSLTTTPSCGPTPCFFDLRMGYNAINTQPYANALQSTWMDLLQTCINKQMVLTNAKSLNELRMQNSGANYEALISEFVSTFQTVTASNQIQNTVINPDSNNILMITKHSIFEISRSGVQSRFADGTCLPSNIALCPYCFWADSGKACRPCIFKDETSVAWKTSCSSYYCMQNSNRSRRRLFSTDQKGKVVFVLSGNQDMFKQLWPNASFTSWGVDRQTIVLASNNIQRMITDVNIQLARLNNNTQIHVQPYGIESGLEKGTTHLVFVLNNTNTSLVQTLWPNSTIEANKMNITVKIKTSDNPDEDMRSLRIQLLQTTGINVLIAPYLRLDLNNPSENENDVIFEINSTDISRLKGLWPKGVFKQKTTSITVIIPFSGNTTTDTVYASHGFKNNTDLALIKPPSFRGRVQNETAPTPIAYATLATLEINETQKITGSLLTALVNNISHIMCTANCNVSVLSVKKADNVTIFCANNLCPGLTRRRSLLGSQGCIVNIGVITSEPIGSPPQNWMSTLPIASWIIKPNAPVISREQLSDSKNLIQLIESKYSTYIEITKENIAVYWVDILVFIVIVLVIGMCIKCCCCREPNGYNKV